jgi:hypothetical protein
MSNRLTVGSSRLPSRDSATAFGGTGLVKKAVMPNSNASVSIAPDPNDVATVMTEDGSVASLNG